MNNLHLIQSITLLLLNPWSSSMKSHHKPAKTNLTFTIHLIYCSNGLERKMEKLTPRDSCSMSRSLESCQSYKEKSITEARERCNICHSQMNSSYFFPIGKVCTLWEFDLTMINLMAFCFKKKTMQLSQYLIASFAFEKGL